MNENQNLENQNQSKISNQDILDYFDKIKNTHENQKNSLDIDWTWTLDTKELEQAKENISKKIEIFNDIIKGINVFKEKQENKSWYDDYLADTGIEEVFDDTNDFISESYDSVTNSISESVDEISDEIKLKWKKELMSIINILLEEHNIPNNETIIEILDKMQFIATWEEDDKMWVMIEKLKKWDEWDPMLRLEASNIIWEFSWMTWTRFFNTLQQQMIKWISLSVKNFDNDYIVWYNELQWNYLIKKDTFIDTMDFNDIGNINSKALENFALSINSYEELKEKLWEANTLKVMKYWQGLDWRSKSYNALKEKNIITEEILTTLPWDMIKWFIDKIDIGLSNTDKIFDNYINNWDELSEDAKEFMSENTKYIEIITDKNKLIQILDYVSGWWIDIKLWDNINKKFHWDIDIIEKINTQYKWNNLWTLDIKMIDESFIKNISKKDFERLVKICDKYPLINLLVRIEDKKIEEYLKNSNISLKKKEIILEQYKRYENQDDLLGIELAKFYEKWNFYDKDINYNIIDNSISKMEPSAIIWIIDFLLEEWKWDIKYFSKLPKLTNTILDNHRLMEQVLDVQPNFIIYLNKEQRKDPSYIIQIIQRDDFKTEHMDKLKYFEPDPKNINSLFLVFRILKEQSIPETLFTQAKHRAKIISVMNEIVENNIEVNILKEFEKEFHDVAKILENFNSKIKQLKEDYNNIWRIEKWSKMENEYEKQINLMNISDPSVKKTVMMFKYNFNWEKVLDIEHANKLSDSQIKEVIKIRKQILDKIINKDVVITGKSKKEIELKWEAKQKFNEKNLKAQQEFLNEDSKIDIKKLKYKFTKFRQNNSDKWLNREELIESFILTNSINTFNEKAINDFKQKLNAIIDKEKLNIISEDEWLTNLYIENLRWNISDEDFNNTLDIEIKKVLNKKVEKIEAEEKAETEALNNSENVNNTDLFTSNNTEYSLNISGDSPSIKTENWIIDISQEEAKKIRNNPNSEIAENIITFHDTLKKVWLWGLWNYRSDISNSIWSMNWSSINNNDDSLWENELKIFLNSILLSVWEVKISESQSLDLYINDFNQINNVQISWEHKDSLVEWWSDIEEKFMKKYITWFSKFQSTNFQNNIQKKS